MIPTQIIPSVKRHDLSPQKTLAQFKELIQAGARFKIAGTARKNPTSLLESRYRPKHRLDLFSTRIYLTSIQQIPELRFFVAYVVQNNRRGKPEIFPRIFYKDLSLAWRSASHFCREEEGIWIGKGDVREEFENGQEFLTSIESTTDLPLEMMIALDELSRKIKRPRGNEFTLDLILKKSASNRVQPYSDFTSPRRLAAADKSNLINRGKSIARFTRQNDPTSLKFTPGFEPDFSDGVLEKSTSRSKLYHGLLKRFRILSTNRKIQYLFISGPKHTWIIPPQATTTELSSYCVRTIDVIADDDLFIPGYEYHHYEETESGEPELFSQIPPGFVGETCEIDDAKADASPWLDELPVIKEFRRRVLAKR